MKKKNKAGKKRIRAVIEKSKKGFSAKAVDIPVTADGNTLAEIKVNLAEALHQHLKKKVKQKNLALEIELGQFFQYYKVLNAKFLADRIGMNPTLLSQYVQGRKKPSVQQLEKIISGITQIGKELSNLRLIAG